MADLETPSEPSTSLSDNEEEVGDGGVVVVVEITLRAASSPGREMKVVGEMNAEDEGVVVIEPVLSSSSSSSLSSTDSEFVVVVWATPCSSPRSFSSSIASSSSSAAAASSALTDRSTLSESVSFSPPASPDSSSSSDSVEVGEAVVVVVVGTLTMGSSLGGSAPGPASLIRSGRSSSMPPRMFVVEGEGGDGSLSPSFLCFVEGNNLALVVGNTLRK